MCLASLISISKCFLIITLILFFFFFFLKPTIYKSLLFYKCKAHLAFLMCIIYSFAEHYCLQDRPFVRYIPSSWKTSFKCDFIESPGITLNGEYFAVFLCLSCYWEMISWDREFLSEFKILSMYFHCLWLLLSL